MAMKVEIKDNKCEGMISLRDMQDDFYYLDEENYCVIGQRNGTKYKLGDELKIKVKRANLSRKQLDFEMIYITQKEKLPLGAFETALREKGIGYE